MKCNLLAPTSTNLKHLTNKKTQNEKPSIKNQNSIPSKNLLQPKFNDYLTQINFGRALKKAKDAHLGYLGANYTGDGKADFRVYAPYAKQIELQISDKNHDFKYWEALSDKDKEKIGLKNIKMNQAEGGMWELSLDEGVTPGQLYRFKLIDKNNNEKHLKDPRSMAQPNDALGWSQIYDNNAYKWNDKNWIEGKDPAKLKHNGSLNSYGAPSGMIIQELHIGVLGGYEKAKNEIDKIAEEGICNSVYLLPVGEFYGKNNWGFDEVDKYAPESSYGKPDELKSFVDYAHSKKINVILDVVPNHFGPIGTVVHEYGDAFDVSRETGWAVGLNFKNQNKEYMRNYMVDMMMHWLINYHFDGLRIDATEQLDSDATLKLMAAEIRNHAETKNTILIPEHIDKTRKLAQPLTEQEIENPQATADEADKDVSKQKRLGYDTQYVYDFKNTLQGLAIGWDIYDCPPSIKDLETEYKQGYRFWNEESQGLRELNGNNSLVYISAHDEKNAFGGARSIIRTLTSELGLLNEKALTSPDGLDKKPFNDTFKLLKSYLSGDYKALEKEGISKEKFETAYKTAQAKNRLLLGAMFIHPGQKLLFMGDQRGELAPFKFFAEYDNPEIAKNVSREKGYNVGEQALNDSKLNQKVYTDNQLKRNTLNFTQDLAKLVKENDALKNGDYNKVSTYGYTDKVMHVLRKDDNGNDILAVMNFGNEEYPEFILKETPQGKWQEVLNSNDKKYGGSGEFLNTKDLNGDNPNIKLPQNSIVIFKKVK